MKTKMKTEREDWYYTFGYFLGAAAGIFVSVVGMVLILW